MLREDFGSLAPRPSADCPTWAINSAVKIGAMQAVWSRLEYLFPAVARNAQKCWLARRSGDLRHLIEGKPVYECLRSRFGPGTREEWELLAWASLQAAGVHLRGYDESYEKGQGDVA